MKTFIITIIIGSHIRSFEFDAVSTERAIVIARELAATHGADSYTMRDTGDFKRLAA